MVKSKRPSISPSPAAYSNYSWCFHCTKPIVHPRFERNSHSRLVHNERKQNLDSCIRSNLFREAYRPLPRKGPSHPFRLLCIHAWSYQKRDELCRKPQLAPGIYAVFIIEHLDTWHNDLVLVDSSDDPSGLCGLVWQLSRKPLHLARPRIRSAG